MRKTIVISHENVNSGHFVVFYLGKCYPQCTIAKSKNRNRREAMRIGHEDLTNYTKDIFSRAGVSDKEAQIVAE